jgi:uncharacterized RmlC-like cupin family protein
LLVAFFYAKGNPVQSFSWSEAMLYGDELDEHVTTEGGDMLEA